jgi:hypothetical protein
MRTSVAIRCVLGAVGMFGSVLLSGSVAVAEGKFQPLFDGKTLNGWQGDPELWRVENGELIGSTDNKQLKRNSFLSTTKSYRNFVLRLKFKLRNHNSGVQYRSKQHPDYVVRGYQADIADNQYLGILYEEGGRGILKTVDGKEVAKHYKPDDWNEYVITVDGPHITQALNGFTTVDYVEQDEAKGAKEGIIGLQLHTGPKMEIRFKDIEIKELP